MFLTTLRRGLVSLTLVTAVFAVTSDASAVNIAGEIVGLDKVQQVLPHLDGVDDHSGAVQRVAILDSGIDYDHPALDGRVIDGINYAANATWGATDPDSWDDRNGHGTFVTGVVGSDHANAPGVLPRIEFVSVRVLAQDGAGSFHDVVSGLNWVADHADALNITAVNLSLGSETVYADPESVPNWSITEDLTDAFARLKAENMVTVVASGNGGETAGLSLPAILGDVISVGATNSNDSVASFTNRNDQLELLAPGTGIKSLWKNGRTAQGSGTSYAAPWVTGAAVMLREAYQQFTGDLAGNYTSFQDRLVSLLQSSGESVYDSPSDRTYARLDLAEAINTVYAEFGEGTPIPEPATLALMLIGLGMLYRPRTRAE